MKSKRHFLRIVFAMSLTFVAILSGCKGDDDDDKYVYKEQSVFADDVEAFTDFAISKELFVMTYLKMTSDGFTTELLKDDEFTYAEIDNLLEQIAYMSENMEEYETALSHLQSSGVLLSVTNKGLLSSIKGFGTWITGAGKRSRDRILTVASNMNESQRTAVYQSLRSEWKSKAKNEQDFWEKLQDGDFDTSAPQMFSDLSFDINTDFPEMAQDKGLSLHKIIYEEGAAGVEAGGELYADVIISAAGPGASALNLQMEVDEFIDKKIVVVVTEKMLSQNLETVMASTTSTDVNVDKEKVISTVAFVQTQCLNKDASLTEIKENKEIAMVTVTDSGDGVKADLMIAQKKDANGEIGSIYVSCGNTTEGEKTYTSGLLTPGEWYISVIDDLGNRYTQLADLISGQINALLALTNASPEEGGDEDDDYDDWDKAAIKYPIMNNVPKFGKPISEIRTEDVTAYGYVISTVKIAYFDYDVNITASDITAYVEKLAAAGITVTRQPEMEVNTVDLYYIGTISGTNISVCIMYAKDISTTIAIGTSTPVE